EEGFAFQEFAKLPILNGGRPQPIDSLARNALLQLRGKQTANYEPWKEWYQKPRIVSATEWLLEVMANPAIGDTRPVSRIDNRDAGRVAAEAKRDGKPFDEKALNQIFGEVERFSSMEHYDEFGTKIEMRMAMLLPPEVGTDPNDWRRVSQALLEMAHGETP